MKIWVFIALFALLMQSPSAATGTGEDSPVIVSARAEPSEIKLGDPFRYIVEVASESDVEVVVPVLSGQFGEFPITDFGEFPTKTEGDRTIVARWYTMTIYESGDHLIPKPKAFYRVPEAEMAEIEGNEVLVGVESLIEGAGDIRDIKKPYELPRNWWPLLIPIGLFILGALLILLFYRLLNRPRRKNAIPTRPAYEVALAELRSLKRRGLIKEGRFEEYYVAVSSIVRNYLEDGFGLRAPEMTTEEFLGTASSDQRLDSSQRRLLTDFLVQADLVKFARHSPSEAESEGTYESARKFVDETSSRAGSPSEPREGASRAAA